MEYKRTSDLKRVPRWGAVLWTLNMPSPQWRVVEVGGMFIHQECNGNVVNTRMPSPEQGTYISVCELCGQKFIIPDMWAGE